MPVPKTVTLSDEDIVAIKAALDAADALCTAVISGEARGRVQLALGVSRALDTIKRRRIGAFNND